MGAGTDIGNSSMNKRNATHLEERVSGWGSSLLHFPCVCIEASNPMFLYLRLIFTWCTRRANAMISNLLPSSEKVCTHILLTVLKNN